MFSNKKSDQSKSKSKRNNSMDIETPRNYYNTLYRKITTNDDITSREELKYMTADDFCTKLLNDLKAYYNTTIKPLCIREDLENEMALSLSEAYIISSILLVNVKLKMQSLRNDENRLRSASEIGQKLESLKENQIISLHNEISEELYPVPINKTKLKLADTLDDTNLYLQTKTESKISSFDVFKDITHKYESSLGKKQKIDIGIELISSTLFPKTFN